ncbi:MAG: hypothetical protein J2P17_07500 [Mycobacterium sp.]|nr:hypothetical protein [Mycobacterium sp.]
MRMTGELSAADAAHRAWLSDLYAKAAVTVGATTRAEPVFGWNDRSAGGRVDTPEGRRWLRVVVEAHEWAEGAWWTGNVDANVLTDVPKPEVIAHWDAADGQWAVRAELSTLLDGSPCSPTPELRQPLTLDNTWWHTLRGALDSLAATPTTRVHLRQSDLTRRLAVFFGNRPGDTTIHRWATAHSDLHWANLLHPRCAVVDWEGWGQAPAGYDAATLYAHSLLVPAMAEDVHTLFADLLNARDGLLVQLAVTARLLLRIDAGDYPDLAIPLHRNAHRVLDALSRPR